MQTNELIDQGGLGFERAVDGFKHGDVFLLGQGIDDFVHQLDQVVFSAADTGITLDAGSLNCAATESTFR